jgi:NADH-quinone oxidoreductase subunit J
MWEAIFFYGFAVVAVVAALLMILMKNPVISAAFLVVTFFAQAVLYVLLHAELLAALQILVYAGAIMVLFLFVVMLLNLNRTSFTSYKLFFTKFFALVVLVAILVVFGSMLGDLAYENQTRIAAETPDEHYGYTMGEDDALQSLGRTLFTRFLYPFEIMAVMLLAAVLGAVLMTRKREA